MLYNIIIATKSEQRQSFLSKWAKSNMGSVSQILRFTVKYTILSYHAFCTYLKKTREQISKF